MRKLLGLIIVLAFAVAACGGDDGTPAGESLLARAAAEGGISLPEPLDASPVYLVAPQADAEPETVAGLERVPG
jgi:hypothetical protein